MIIKQIAHSAYGCTDMEKSLHFYCGVLGLRKVFELHSEGDKPWINYLKISDGNFIELFHTDPGTPAFNREHISYSHICLEVYDINQAVDAIQKAGYPIVSGPSQGMDLNWQAWVTDPDGNRVELMQINPESPQMKIK